MEGTTGGWGNREQPRSGGGAWPRSGKGVRGVLGGLAGRGSPALALALGPSWALTEQGFCSLTVVLGVGKGG